MFSLLSAAEGRDVDIHSKGSADRASFLFAPDVPELLVDLLGAKGLEGLLLAELLLSRPKSRELLVNARGRPILNLDSDSLGCGLMEWLGRTGAGEMSIGA